MVGSYPVVGREAELAAVREFVEGPALVPALVISGAPGIGKTTLWEATVALARERGWNVLVSRASEAEEELSFAVLADLLDTIGEDTISQLAPPQRHALEVALARVAPSGAPPGELAIAAGLLSVLRLPSLGEHVLIAVDEAQWLDRATASALSYAVRRAVGERVRLLLAIRAGHSSPVERDIASRRLELEAMTLLDARRLITRELGLSVPRPLMNRLYQAADGNPLVVLELGRLLVERGTLELGSELPAPALAGELFGARVEALPANVGHALLATALSAHLSRVQLMLMSGPTAVEDAAAHGVLTVEGDRVRAAHPLLAAAARERATPSERERVHLELSELLDDELQSARHLALATAKHDSARAAVLSAAAATARRRGATRDALELSEQALRLTPLNDPQQVERLLTLAENMFSAGELGRLRQLEPRLERLPPGAPLARAHLLLADTADLVGHDAHLERAIAEGADEPALRAAALAAKVLYWGVLRVERITELEEWAREGFEAAHLAGPAFQLRALTALAWARVLRGTPIDDLKQLAPYLPEGQSLYEASIERVAAVRRGFRGEIELARAAFEQLLALADERGEALSAEIMLLHLAETALRVGDCIRARQVLETWEDWAAFDETLPGRTRCHALLAVHEGEPERAIELAERVLELTDDGWDLLETKRVLGVAALLAGSPQQAAEHLGQVWEHTQREGVLELGAFPVAVDLVRSLADLGREDEALEIAGRVRELAESQQHPWGLATATRCEAVIALSRSYDEGAASALAEAAAAYAELGLTYDGARTLLARGQLLRRYRKWGAARESLERAADAFDQLGAGGWAALARAELSRVGARRRADEGELTAAEGRVVALAANGMSNKEIAGALVISVHTVEVHLSHAYAKLGVRSRSQLAGALGAPTGVSGLGTKD